jgi:acyl-coenzyme A thioesterase PaaI-like protein
MAGSVLLTTILVPGQGHPVNGLGIVFERYEPDDVTIRLPWREDLANDGATFHGGVYRIA